MYWQKRFSESNSDKKIENLINEILKNTHIPYQKITTNTTEFKYYTKDQNDKTDIKKAYLDPFLDLFNGEILSHRLSQQPNAKEYLDTLEETITIAEKVSLSNNNSYGSRLGLSNESI